MGRAYSLNGYLNAVLRRSARTVLVEGPSDKEALHRIEAEHFTSKTGESTIDYVDMLDDPQLAGMGNRLKVLAVRAEAEALSANLPKITAVLATLIDREWDGLSFVSFVPSPGWSAPSQNPGHFVTLGHSIENYHFDADCVIEYLKFAFPSHLTAAVLAAIREHFPAMLALATVLSLKVRDDDSIGKCTGLVTLHDILINKDRIYLDQSFAAACAKRDIPSATTIVADVNSAVDAAWSSLTKSDCTRWLPHGHIGDDVLWCATAKIALLRGVPAQVANDIACGSKKQRRQLQALWLGKRSTPTLEPLYDAIEWLHR